MMKLKEIKKIGIAGAGGIGSNLLAILFDYGYTRKQFDYANLEVDIYDDDIVDNSNLLHQRFTLDDVGKHKVAVLEEKFVVNGIKKFMTEKDLKKYDVVFSCVDSMTFRKMLYEYAWNNTKAPFWIDGRCTSRQGALFNSELRKEDLLPYISESEATGGCLLEWEKEEGMSHVMPLVVAGMMAQAFLNWMRSQRTDKKIIMV